jgi:hypothetical protein
LVAPIEIAHRLTYTCNDFDALFMDACLINQQRNNVWDIKKTAGSSAVLYLGALVLLYVVTSLMPCSGTNLCHQVDKSILGTQIDNDVKYTMFQVIMQPRTLLYSCHYKLLFLTNQPVFVNFYETKMFTTK